MCVLKGGFKFFSDLIEEMQRTIWARKTELCITVEFIRVKSYTDTTSGQVNIRSIDNAMPIRDKVILHYVFYIFSFRISLLLMISVTLEKP